MRGAERPANVRWTRPFLGPLKPLGQDAACQTFIDIADDIHEMHEIDKILLLADNMPLAINLIAHLVDSEGMSNVLSRWDRQRTSILSDGHDATSNLELSISLSLSGSRMISSPHALDLLSLLSMLPDGLSNVELLQIPFPLENILACKSTLLRTALAYTDGQKRLKALVPIREYVQRDYPPSQNLIHLLSKHYQELLEIHRKYQGTLSNAGVMARVASNFANIQNVLLHCLSSDRPHLSETITGICDLTRYSRLAGHGNLVLEDQIPSFLSQSTDHKLKAYFIIQVLNGWRYHSISNANQLVDQALEHFKHFDDPDMECELMQVLYLIISVETTLGLFYAVVANYHSVHQDHDASMHFCQSGLSLAISIGSLDRQSKALVRLALLKMDSGDFPGAREVASESQRAAKIAGNLLIEASAFRIEGICWQYLGNYSHCLSLLDRAIYLLDLCGMSGGATHSVIRVSQAEVYRCKSEYVEARNIHIHILHNSSADQTPYDHALALLNIAQIDVEDGGSVQDVQQNLDAAQLLFQKLKFSTGLMFCDSIRAALDLRQGKLLAARSLFKSCLGPKQDTEAVSYCLEKLGAATQWILGDQISFSWTVTFLAHSVKCKQRLEIHKALQFLGDVFLAQGDEETALNLFTVALNGFIQMDVHRNKAECMVRLGKISKLNGDFFKAAGLWESARPLFERSSQREQLADLDAKLARLAQEWAQ
jgi:tetratricopeptide (TPR) repeat protein